MLVDRPVREGGPERRRGGRRGRRRSRSELNLPAAVAFAATAALVLLYALRGGGSYDIVTFEEYGLAIWWVLALAFALGLLPRRRPAVPMLVLFGALAAYSGWTALSLLWSQSAQLTMQELARSLDYLGLVVLLGLALDRSTWRSAAAGLGFGAFGVCVIAVGSRLDPGVFGRDQLDAVYHMDRLSYPFGYWNAVAAWGAMCVALGLTWSAHDQSRVRRSLALAFVPVAGVMVYLTYSRGGVLGGALAVLAALTLSRNRMTALAHTLVAAVGTALAIVAVRHSYQIAHATGANGAATVLGALIFAIAACVCMALLTRGRVDALRVPRPLVRPLALAGAIIVLVPGVAFGPRLVTHAWHSFKRPPVATATANPTARLGTLASSRYPIWKGALKDFRAHPVGGTGAGTFAFYWNQFGITAEAVQDVHNLWLENMAELGFPGLLLIVAVALGALALGAIVRARAQRASSAGAAAAMLAVFVVYLLHASIDWMWESTAISVLAFGAVAIAGARVSGERFRFRLPLRPVAALVAVGFGLLQLPGLLSTSEIRHSQAAEHAGNASLALAWATNAVSAEPWSASAYEQEGLVLESAGKFRQAKQELDEAISYEPYNYRHWLIRSRIETELGQLDAALHDFALARQLRPHAGVFALAPYFRATKATQSP